MESLLEEICEPGLCRSSDVAYPLSLYKRGRASELEDADADVDICSRRLSTWENLTSADFILLKIHNNNIGVERVCAHHST